MLLRRTLAPSYFNDAKCDTLLMEVRSDGFHGVIPVVEGLEDFNNQRSIPFSRTAQFPVRPR